MKRENIWKKKKKKIARQGKIIYRRTLPALSSVNGTAERRPHRQYPISDFFPHLCLSLIAAFLTDEHNMYLGTITCTWVIF